MGKRLGLKVLAVLAALAMVVSCTAVLYSGTEAEKGATESRGKGVISLMPPPFIALAGATETAAEEAEGAFPEDEAGIAAYVNVNQSIDFEKLVTILDPLINVTGGVYIHGKTKIPNFGGDVHPHIYANTNGWLVAYFTKDENASMLMQWSGTDVNNPNITEITTTTLEDAIEKACNATGVNYTEIQPNIKYYDFEFPDANSMMIFVKTQATEGSDYIHISIPSDYMLYEASYFHYIYYYSYHHTSYSGYYETYWDSKLKVDGTTVSDASTTYYGAGYCKWWRVFDSYKVYITTGTPHNIEISYEGTHGQSVDHGSAGVATVLIYKSPY